MPHCRSQGVSPPAGVNPSLHERYGVFRMRDCTSPPSLCTHTYKLPTRHSQAPAPHPASAPSHDRLDQLLVSRPAAMSSKETSVADPPVSTSITPVRSGTCSSGPGSPPLALQMLPPPSVAAMNGLRW